MSILVTGGAGFIGSHLVDELIELGHQVVVIDDLSTGNRDNLNKFAMYYQMDIRDNLKEIFINHTFDYVFHLAAQINLRDSIKRPSEDASTNIVGSLNLIEYAVKHRVKKFIFSSTGGAIYDPTASIPWDDSARCRPNSPYGLAKLTVEKYLEISKQIHGLDYTALRYSNVYGPRQNAHGEAGVIAIFIDHLLSKKDLKIFGDGRQSRDFVYVDDVVKANVLAMKKSMSGTYNVCSNSSVEVNHIAKSLISKLSSDSKINYVDAVDGEIKHTLLSYDGIRVHGWRPTVYFEDGLDRTLRSFVKA